MIATDYAKNRNDGFRINMIKVAALTLAAIEADKETN